MKKLVFIAKIISILILLNIYILMPASAQAIDGAAASEIGQCSIKSCFINILMIYKSEILKQQKNSNGSFFEIYKIQRRNDVSLDDYTKMVVSSGNSGLWNIVNYPIEGYVSDNTHVIFKTTYNDKEVATKIEIQLPD